MAKRQGQLRARKMAAQKERCYYCGQPMWHGDDAAFRARFKLSRRRAMLFQCTAEHLKPKCDGGKTGAANIVAACLFCNVTRHRARMPRSPDSYRKIVRRRLSCGRWQRVAGAGGGEQRK
jgi:hypothetical protein